jgi:hypothetical protein
MREGYIKLIKEAKKRKIKTRDDLSDLLSEVFDDCDGGEFECAVKELKIKSELRSKGSNY